VVIIPVQSFADSRGSIVERQLQGA